MAYKEDQQVDDACLLNLKGELAQEWLEVGRRLGLRDNELQNLRKDNFQRQEDINYQMLSLWLKKNCDKATYGVLAKALQESGRNDLEQKLLAGGFDDVSESDNIPQAGSKTISRPADSRAVSSDAPTPAALARVDLPRYEMKRKPRGKCLILTYDDFNDDEKWNRPGNDADEKKLREVFKILGFDVDYKRNLKYKETKEIIQEMAEKNFFDSFVLFVCSHGKDEGFYTSDKELIKFQEDVIKPFKTKNCHGFASKPKLFFFNTCRGAGEEEMVEYERDFLPSPEEGGLVANTSNYRPNEADFCIVFGTVSGYVNWRNRNTGSYFVQNLCTSLKANYKTHHLIDILTISNNTLLEEFEKIRASAEKDGKKAICQVPHLNSTLCKAVYFIDE